MDSVSFYAGLRQLIGDPNPNEVSQRKLSFHVNTALEDLAATLEYLVLEGDFVQLVASQAAYPLPADLLTVLWVSYNNLKLDPSSTWTWDRDGTNWRASTAGKPTSFATEGRLLYLNPAPDQTNITAYATMKLRYIAVPGGLPASGPQSLSDMDQRIAQHLAAVHYCMVNRSDENERRKEDYEAWIAEQMPLARKRAKFLIADFYPSFRPLVGRMGAAR